MKFNSRWLAIVLIASSLTLTACSTLSEVSAEEISPATVEHLESGPNPTRIVLTEDAVQRLDLQTVAVAALNSDAKEKVIPYAAILYDTEGKTWIYTNPDKLTFLRSPVTVEHIDGDSAIISDGPAVGEQVVTIGATELYGSESEFEEE